MGVGEATGLLGHDRAISAAAVAHVDDDRAAGGVEVLAAVRVPDRGTVRFDGDRWIGHGRTAEDGPGGRVMPVS